MLAIRKRTRKTAGAGDEQEAGGGARGGVPLLGEGRRMSSKLTAFEKAVYRAVMEIPFGETRSYAWVAYRIGRPMSARAVGNALHKNPFAPWVPCHRVIASGGALGGYSGGLKKKAELLKRERALKSRWPR